MKFLFMLGTTLVLLGCQKHYVQEMQPHDDTGFKAGKYSAVTSITCSNCKAK